MSESHDYAVRILAAKNRREAGAIYAELIRLVGPSDDAGIWYTLNSYILESRSKAWLGKVKQEAWKEIRAHGK